jgi:hypothetical protein
MKRTAIIVFSGLAIALTAYCAVYFQKTSKHRELAASQAPELAWLRDEFHLSDAEFERISELHDAYMPHCQEMCRRIDKKNVELKELLTATNTMTAAIEEKLAESSQLRLECQKQMLQHFLEVGRQMPPEQARRYLSWVQERTFLPSHGMTAIH